MMDATAVVAARQGETTLIQHHSNLVAPVRRSSEQRSSETDSARGGRGDKQAHDSTIHRSLEAATPFAASATMMLHPLARKQAPEQPILRQTPVPAGAPSMASVHVPQPAKGLFRSSVLTHRSVSAMERLYRTMDVGLAHSSSSMEFGNARQVVARDAANTAPVSFPTLPTVTNQSSGGPGSFKKTEIAQLANRVYELLVRRLDSERQRRGH